MQQITNFRQAQDALRPYYDYSRTPYTLDAIRQLLDYLGNPQDMLRVVHVAGTSGKTSTAYYCATLLRETGASVGLTVSPHVDNLNERVQINGAPLAETEFCTLLGEFMELLADAPCKPSYFELMTALAYWEFARRKLDYVVIEVGLGGRLDATNAVTRADKICVITDIGLDHTEILGDTLAKIANEKVGIIQPYNTVYMYQQNDEVMDVVRYVAKAKMAELHELVLTDTVVLNDLPLFQQRNLGLARQAVNYVLQRDGRPTITAEQLTAAAAITVPARLERFTHNGKTIIVDGSHNQQKLHALVGSVRQLYPDQKIAVLTGFVRGNAERWQGGLNELLPFATDCIFTGFYGEQDIPKSSVEPGLLGDYAISRQYQHFTVEPDPEVALQLLLKRPEPILLITGSFYLLNHIRPLILK